MRSLRAAGVVAALCLLVARPLSAQTAPEAHRTDAAPLAGYHNGLFFLRDPDDNFRLYFQARAQIDSYNYAGRGVADTGLKSTVFLRRIRPELSGEVLHDFTFMLSGDWGQTGNDNVLGTNESSAAAPGKAPTATTGKYASAETATLRAQPTDVWLIYRAHDLLHVQVGQFDAPFTMDNRTSDKYIPFMERSLGTRNIGVPTNKEMGVMVWGEDAGRHVFYSVGAFNGDGQNKLSPDNRADVIGRAFVHPLRGFGGALEDMQVGGSFRYGHRDPVYVTYDYNTMTTQGGYAFWSPVYVDSSARRVHVLPSKAQLGVAGEVRIPISIVDLIGEAVVIRNQTREAVEGFQSSNTERLGTMKGYSYYAQLGIWIVGQRDVNGLPGYENPPHLDLTKAQPKEPAQAVQLLFKWEQLKVAYNSAERGGTADKNAIDGDIKVNAVSAGVNYWATKHVRLTANYVVNMFPGSEPVKPSQAGGPQQDGGQRATAPANNLPIGVRNDARDAAHVLHEILFRAAVAF